MARFVIFSRYDKTKTFGQWQVGSFPTAESAEEYRDRTMKRYLQKHPEFEMVITVLPDAIGKALDEHLMALID